MNRKQAKALYERNVFRHETIEHKAHFQMNEERLCMPWTDFQESVEETLDNYIPSSAFANQYDALNNAVREKVSLWTRFNVFMRKLLFLRRVAEIGTYTDLD